MEERGQYITLLCHCWIEDGIPIGSPLVKQWLKKDSILNDCFYKKNGKIRHKRLDKEREKQIKWAEKSSKGGKKTQEKRWEGVKKESRGDRLSRAKQKGTHTEKDWQMMKEICGNKCVKCKIPETQLYGEKLCKDHIIPICLNGSDAIENIQPLCRNCNTAKTNDQTDYRPNGWKQLLTNGKPKGNTSSAFSSASLKKSLKHTPEKPSPKKTELEEEFEEFWEGYKAMGNSKNPIGDKGTAYKAFKTLRKKITKDELIKALWGEADYLKHERLVNNFDKRKKYASTWLRSDKWREHKDFKYKARL